MCDIAHHVGEQGDGLGVCQHERPAPNGRSGTEDRAEASERAGENEKARPLQVSAGVVEEL